MDGRMQNAKISNGRLPPEDGSDRRETLGKRVSDDLQLLIFRRPKLFLKVFEFFFDVSFVLEERALFKRLWQIDREKLLPVVRLFFHYEL